MNDKLPQKWFTKPEQTGFTVRRWWAFRSRSRIESLSATQTRGVNHSRLGAPQLKFLTHIFAIFFHAMPCSPQSKTNSIWKLFRVLPTTKWNRADHILLYTRPPTTLLAVFLCLSWVSMRTAGPHSFSQTHTNTQRLNENKCTALSVKYKPNL